MGRKTDKLKWWLRAQAVGLGKSRLNFVHQVTVWSQKKYLMSLRRGTTAFKKGVDIESLSQDQVI